MDRIQIVGEKKKQAKTTVLFDLETATKWSCWLQKYYPQEFFICENSAVAFVSLNMVLNVELQVGGRVSPEFLLLWYWKISNKCEIGMPIMWELLCFIFLYTLLYLLIVLFC